MASSQSVNHWPDSRCAKAFWSQHEAPSYQRLLADTAAWFDPQPEERWLDLGCGCGKLTKALWEKSAGRLGEVIGADCAAENEQAFRQLREALGLPASKGKIRFFPLDFSKGLPAWNCGYFDGVVSGLAIQYAEAFSAEKGEWTTEAYDRLLAEVERVLRPGGRFIFSVNVPEPAWGKVAFQSLPAVLKVQKPLRFLKRSWRMMRYGSWLKREARRGRFHFLPLQTILSKLEKVGFRDIEYQLTYAKQAYLFKCRKA